MTNCSCIGYNIRKDDKARWEKTCNSSSTFVQIKYRSSTDQVQIKYRSSTDQVQIKMVAVNCVRKVNMHYNSSLETVHIGTVHLGTVHLDPYSRKNLEKIRNGRFL